MAVAKRIYHNLKNHEAKVAYTNLFSKSCRLLGLKSLMGQIGEIPLYVSLDDNWGLRKFYFGDFSDADSIQRLKEILMSKKDFLFWDVGANYGAYALSLNAYSAQTIAIEPYSRTFQHLKRSRDYSSARIILENCAAGDKVGEITLHLAPNFSGDNRIYQPEQDKQRPTERVAMKTIDEIASAHFRSLPENNLMKIDVQGAECLVLRGAERVIRESRTIIIWIEVWPTGLSEAGNGLDELIEICDSYGLVPIDISNDLCSWESIIHELNDPDVRWSNVLLSKTPTK